MGGRPVEDDDGRVLAEMGDVVRPPLLMPQLEFRRPRAGKREPAAPEAAGQPVRMDRAQRRAMLGGALSAAGLIALVFAVCFAVLILVIQWIYG